MLGANSFSPTAFVRKSCRNWMDVVQYDNTTRTAKKCSVSINNDALDHFAMKITDSIIANKSLQVSEWDADGWHYTGKNYKVGSTDEFDILMRMERIALYVLTMDAINFCFWPTTKEDVKNCLEYEHLAIALRKAAELDDNNNEVETHGNNTPIRASSTYALSPENLSILTPKQLQCMLTPYLPSDETMHFEIPDISIRCELLNELGLGILEKHNGSALHMIEKAHRSADALVNIILESFPGFRDFVSIDAESESSKWKTVKQQSSTVHFYKRAQIAVADIWAALGRNVSLAKSNDDSQPLRCCEFNDMPSITTFPDYRVPQILRHVGVMKYEDDLAQKVDGLNELEKGCHDEVSIRAGTVVAVDDLVLRVKEKLAIIACNAVGDVSKKDLQTLAHDVSAVTLDWYLWQQGEKLDRQNLLEPHHRVRTTFY